MPMSHENRLQLRRCEEQIHWYDRYSKREWRLFTLFQSAAIRACGGKRRF